MVTPHRTPRSSRSLSRRISIFASAGLLLGAGGSALAMSCSASNDTLFNGNDTGGTGGVGGSATGGVGGEGTAGFGGILVGGSEMDASIDVPVNPCGSECGPEELCDPNHQGTDDNCNGVVDEGCPCSAGQAQACFLGDPSYRDSPGCFDGTMTCSENGTWTDCLGGKHATDNPPCFSADPLGCHPISAVPFQTVSLLTGTGNFSNDAVTSTFSVTCPSGVNPCPAVMAPDSFQPLQSGEYTISYQKTLANNSTESCEFPLFVGARGLRVELEWEHDLGSDGVDLDLHLHQPGTTTPWDTSGAPQDCGYGNCTIDSLSFGFSPPPDWFPAANVPPDPVSWYLDPVFEQNLCFFAPRGAGQSWIDNGMGCHNPRLDIDNVYCDPAITDPQNSSFCAPENINIDYPPQDQWMRMAVHYYSNHGLTYDVHPNLKVFCNGALSAELGSGGYNAPVTFTSASGSTMMWLVADVVFTKNECSEGCTVQPLYQDPAAETPFFTTASAAEANFGPAYPPVPMRP